VYVSTRIRRIYILEGMIEIQDKIIFIYNLRPITGSWLFPPCMYNGKHVLEIGTIIIKVLYDYNFI